MNFQRTDRKIREVCQHLSTLMGSKNVDEFEANFAAFITTSRSVTLALQTDAGITFKDGDLVEKGSVTGFSDWYIGKQDEMRKDELCRFFKNTRDEDIHTGNSAIQSSYTIKGGATLTTPKDGSLHITHRGTYEVYDQDTPKEKRIQKKLETEEQFKIALTSTPTKHLGKILEQTDPITLCNLYKTYLENLVFEAKENFLTL
jgi:hypothetical protein